MNIKLLLDVYVDDDYLQSFEKGVSKQRVAEDITNRLALNEVGSGDFYMLKEVNGKLVKYGEPF
jgi:hypothetical protein